MAHEQKRRHREQNERHQHAAIAQRENIRRIVLLKQRLHAPRGQRCGLFTRQKNRCAQAAEQQNRGQERFEERSLRENVQQHGGEENRGGQIDGGGECDEECEANDHLCEAEAGLQRGEVRRAQGVLQHAGIEPFQRVLRGEVGVELRGNRAPILRGDTRTAR